jgi:opacity protein-like surface antigen
LSDKVRGGIVTKVHPTRLVLALAIGLLWVQSPAWGTGTDEPLTLKSFIEKDVIQKISLGFQFDSSLEGEVRSRSYSPKIGFHVLSTDYSNTDLALDIDAYYRYRKVELAAEKQISDTWGINYAKIVMTRLFGYDLAKRVEPYGSLGVEHTSLHATSSADDTAFWALTWGIGLKVPITDRLSLDAGYKQNLKKGRQRFSAVLVGFDYRFLDSK